MSNQIISIDRTESSPTEPVTLTQAKAHLIVSSTDDDTLITSLITQTRKAVENFCNISLARQQITTILVHDYENELPYGPVTDVTEVSTSVTSVGSGPITYQTATSNWWTDGGGFKTFSGSCGLRYRLVYWAGYTTVPDDLKLAILNEIAYRYELRGESQEIRREVNEGLSDAARVLALPYKRMLWI